eukprot:403354633
MNLQQSANSNSTTTNQSQETQSRQTQQFQNTNNNQATQPQYNFRQLGFEENSTSQAVHPPMNRNSTFSQVQHQQRSSTTGRIGQQTSLNSQMPIQMPNRDNSQVMNNQYSATTFMQNEEAQENLHSIPSNLPPQSTLILGANFFGGFSNYTQQPQAQQFQPDQGQPHLSTSQDVALLQQQQAQNSKQLEKLNSWFHDLQILENNLNLREIELKKLEKKFKQDEEEAIRVYNQKFEKLNSQKIKFVSESEEHKKLMKRVQDQDQAISQMKKELLDRNSELTQIKQDFNNLQQQHQVDPQQTHCRTCANQCVLGYFCLNQLNLQVEKVIMNSAFDIFLRYAVPVTKKNGWKKFKFRRQLSHFDIINELHDNLPSVVQQLFKRSNEAILNITKEQLDLSSYAMQFMITDEEEANLVNQLETSLDQQVDDEVLDQLQDSNNQNHLPSSDSSDSSDQQQQMSFPPVSNFTRSQSKLRYQSLQQPNQFNNFPNQNFTDPNNLPHPNNQPNQQQDFPQNTYPNNQFVQNPQFSQDQPMN